MDTFPIYCGGEFIETDEILEVTNPYTGKFFARTFNAGSAELEKAIKSAESVRVTLQDLPSFSKYDILMELANGLASDKQHFAEILSLESGKPIRYAIGEIDRSIQCFRVAAEESRRLPRESMSLDWTPAGKGKEGWVKYFPVGIVAGISPFNFPMNLAVHKIAPAIAAGCPIILKPSSSTPLSVLLLSRLIDKTALPKGAVSILPMNRQIGNQLVTDERISLLSFTGSPVVGWNMKKNAGHKKVVLELGGNAGVIISSSANIEDAVNKCVYGSFAYSGQVCIHTQRIYIHKDVFHSFINQFAAKTNALVKGDPLNSSTDISVMIDEANARRVELWVQEAIEEGASLICGGKRDGGYYEPTVITGTNIGMKVCCEEIFGPVVVVEQIDNFQQGIERVNEGCFGLQAGVFTDSLQEMNDAFNNLEVGGVIINDVPTFRVDHMPYGGIRESGLGREGIRYAILDMMEPRILVKNS